MGLSRVKTPEGLMITKLTESALKAVKGIENVLADLQRNGAVPALAAGFDVEKSQVQLENRHPSPASLRLSSIDIQDFAHKPFKVEQSFRKCRIACPPHIPLHNMKFFDVNVTNRQQVLYGNHIEADQRLHNVLLQSQTIQDIRDVAQRAVGSRWRLAGLSGKTNSFWRSICLAIARSDVYWESLSAVVLSTQNEVPRLTTLRNILQCTRRNLPYIACHFVDLLTVSAMFKVRIDLIHFAGESGWTVTEFQQRTCAFNVPVLSPCNSSAFRLVLVAFNNDNYDVIQPLKSDFVLQCVCQCPRELTGRASTDNSFLKNTLFIDVTRPLSEQLGIVKSDEVLQETEKRDRVSSQETDAFRRESFGLHVKRRKRVIVEQSFNVDSGLLAQQIQLTKSKLERNAVPVISAECALPKTSKPDIYVAARAVLPSAETYHISCNPHIPQNCDIDISRSVTLPATAAAASAAIQSLLQESQHGVVAMQQLNSYLSTIGNARLCGVLYSPRSNVYYNTNREQNTYESLYKAVCLAIGGSSLRWRKLRKIISDYVSKHKLLRRLDKFRVSASPNALDCSQHSQLAAIALLFDVKVSHLAFQDRADKSCWIVRQWSKNIIEGMLGRHFPAWHRSTSNNFLVCVIEIAGWFEAVLRVNTNEEHQQTVLCMCTTPALHQLPAPRFPTNTDHLYSIPEFHHHIQPFCTQDDERVSLLQFRFCNFSSFAIDEQTAAKLETIVGRYKVIDVKGDGNCAMRALSLLFFGHEGYHYQLRSIAMAYVRKNPGLTAYGEDLGVDAYCFKHQMAKEFTGSTEFLALALIFNVRIVVVSPVSQNVRVPQFVPYDRHIHLVPQFQLNVLPGEGVTLMESSAFGNLPLTFILLHVWQNHFQCIFPVTENDYFKCSCVNEFILEEGGAAGSTQELH